MGTLRRIHPPIVNSASPWATTLDNLKELYLCKYTGAITTRTCTLYGFAHDDAVHQFAFFDTASLNPVSDKSTSSAKGLASLNTLGYSPIPLGDTLENIKTIIGGLSEEQLNHYKPVIVSITGSKDEVVECIKLIERAQQTLPVPLLVEINLSCPNIPNKPPPAFSKDGLVEYLNALHQFGNGLLQVGIKTPPYSNPDNFAILQAALLQSIADSPKHTVPIAFITATNTLGCSLLPSPASPDRPHLASADGTGIGGLAGAALHPLALGNVRMLRTMLDGHEALKHVQIIGVGGVSDEAGFDRMLAAGATIVGIGTALGVRGVRVFGEIYGGKDGVGDGRNEG
jgi:dihydroorotate dehydrogenase (fumarate)